MAALDVAIGLIFLYSLLSLICSSLNEWVATKLKWRGKNLEKALRRMLGEDAGTKDGFNAQAVTTNNFISRLAETDSSIPSYIESGTFALAVLDVLTEGSTSGQLVAAQQSLDNLPTDHPAKAPLTRLLIEAGGNLDRFKKSLEGWFNSMMQRTSRWYKRQVQRFLLLYAIIITLLLNVDTVLVTRVLWNDETVRAAIVAQAERVESKNGTGASFDSLVNQVEDVQQLQLPLGWTTARDDPRWPGDSFWEWIAKLVGLSLTVGALTLGAPFWFDLLNKVSNLRNAGGRQAIASRGQPNDPNITEF